MKVKRRKLFVTRIAYYKRDANRISQMMLNAGARTVTTTGKRGEWRVRALMENFQLARFASDEAAYESALNH